MEHRFVLVSTALLIVASGASAAELVWEPAPRADDFVASIGVCTHFQYGNTPYGKSYELVKRRLKESGIRNIRDGYSPRVPELWKDLGVRTDVLTDPPLGSIEKQLAPISANPEAVGMIEGPNEPNLFWKRFGTNYQGQGWPGGVKRWQDQLAQAVKADPHLAGIKLASPTPIFDGPLEAAPLTSFDWLALHPYAGGNMPSMACRWDGSGIRSALLLLGNNDLKPLVATECGYHNSLDGNAVLAGNQSGISEIAGGKYFPRHFAEFWNAGFVRTYVYEFIDERVNPKDPEANFGLVRFDGIPKPSFTAVSNLISLESESTWDAAAGKWTRPEADARALQLAIDAPPSVHHTVLSRADGSFDVLLWNEVSSFDVKARTDLNPKPVPVTLRLAEAAKASLSRPSAGTAALQQWKMGKSFELEVPDEVLVLRLVRPLTVEAAPPAPAGLENSVSATAATLKWHSGGGHPAAYVVRRVGKYIATVVPAEDGSGTFADSGLTPGLGYPYTVSAVGANGLVSAAAETTARTLNQRPDLIVKSVSWTPDHPQPGDEVQFSAVIANQGSAATPAITHGVAFQVNGKTIAWSDTSKEPLASGATRNLTPNNGPAGKGTWTCAEGTFQIVAKVDDVNRIDESNKSNNVYKTKLSTGKGPDLVVTGIRVDGDATAGKPVMLIGTVKNIGTMPTADGVTVSCTFQGKDAAGAAVNAGYGTLHGSLAAGETAEIRLAQPWVPATTGTVAMTGFADDVDRIAELDETNNRSELVMIEVK